MVKDSNVWISGTELMPNWRGFLFFFSYERDYYLRALGHPIRIPNHRTPKPTCLVISSGTLMNKKHMATPNCIYSPWICSIGICQMQRNGNKPKQATNIDKHQHTYAKTLALMYYMTWGTQWSNAWADYQVKGPYKNNIYPMIFQWHWDFLAFARLKNSFSTKTLSAAPYFLQSHMLIEYHWFD